MTLGTVIRAYLEFAVKHGDFFAVPPPEPELEAIVRLKDPE
jgi:hypothetical protein